MSPKLLARLAVEIGQRYIASGGPTSRFEERLISIGKAQNYNLEAWSTGTGVLVSVDSGEEQAVMTHMGRVRMGAINLEMVLQLEQLMDSLGEKEYNYEEAELILETMSSSPRPYWVKLLPLFLIGFASSFPFFRDFLQAITSGLLVIAVSSIAGPLAEKWRFSRIFCDFFATLFVLLTAGFLGNIFGFPVDAMVVGTFIYLVPGSLLANAVSELAEQHFLSGTVKLMKALLILLAMGTAYLLVLDVTRMFGIVKFLGSVNHPAQELYISLLGALTLITSFALAIQVPFRHLVFSAIAGLSGWFTFYFLQFESFIILNTFLPAFIVGTLSLIFGRMRKTPSQLFSIPGIISMVPGMLAFSVFLDVSSSNVNIALQVSIIVGGLTFGLLSSRIPFLLFQKESLLDSLE